MTSTATAPRAETPAQAVNGFLALPFCLIGLALGGASLLALQDDSPLAQVERLAAQELRSANAQVELLLREALARRGIKPVASPAPRRGRPPNESSDDGE